MSIYSGITTRIIPPVAKTLLPAKYYDDIFMSDFINSMDFKMLNLRKTVRSFKLGFLPFEYLWFDLDHNNPKDYLPTRCNYRKRGINGRYNAILANKILFEKHLKSVIAGIDRLHVVDSLGYFESGCLNQLCDEVSFRDIDSLLKVLRQNDLILKQITGDGGVGLLCLEQRDDNLYLNGKPVDRNYLVEFLCKLDNYLIQKRIIQKGLAGEINPGSVNTMRIGTMIDPETGKPFIAYAVHRFGSHKSGFADNVGQGGITARIDIGTGTLSMAHYYTKKGHREVFAVHPMSSVMIYSQQIQGWESVKERIIELASRMPYLKYVGWDMVLSDNDLYILEGNVAPGLGLVQLYDPLKNCTQAWNFFRYYKYIE